MKERNFTYCKIHPSIRITIFSSKQKHITDTYCFRSRLNKQSTRLFIINKNKIPYKHTLRRILSRRVLSPVRASGRMLSQYVTGGSVYVERFKRENRFYSLQNKNIERIKRNVSQRNNNKNILLC